MLDRSDARGAGRSDVDIFVRSALVVPVDMAGQCSSHITAAQWDDDSARALVLKRADEPLNHGNIELAALAAVLTLKTRGLVALLGMAG